MKPIYEFRPLPDYFSGSFKRYANGLWIPDDGVYDLAFIGKALGGAPMCLYVEIPYRDNIVCSWPGHCMNQSHVWHYALKADSSDWGNYDYHSHDEHSNSLARKSGMNKQLSESSCSNGRCVSFRFDEKYINAGLLRDRDTKQVFGWGDIKCHYCGDIPKQTEDNKAIKDAIPRHIVLKGMKIVHPNFGECDCLEVVKELSKSTDNFIHATQNGPVPGC